MVRCECSGKRLQQVKGVPGEELDVAPTQRTQQLYRQIQQDALSLSLPLHWDSDCLAQLQPLMVELEHMQRDLVHLNHNVMRASELVNGLLVQVDSKKIAR